MATRQQHQIVETPTEARQAEPGPSVLALLTVSTGLAILILAVVWFVFFPHLSGAMILAARQGARHLENGERRPGRSRSTIRLSA